ncbi:helix-turn-helix domain-containing protein [Actinacidiphila yeochonensis]|uniref:hypothetical protein n=1 Tax=Actinacidiphila yeochonensis TaxID=89050 RepID=UPI000689D4D0|nr:hypothetical protein [Actinacidiphila yeochonensis]
MGNSVLRDSRISFAARGILAYLLSLPDGARSDVRTLADGNPGLGRRGVAKAVNELIAHGYYVRSTVRDPESGQVRTETYLYDTPRTTGSPLPAPPGPGAPANGTAGTSPSGRKKQGKEPTLPSPAFPDVTSTRRRTKAVREVPAAALGPDATGAPGGRPAAPPEAPARGLALLSRLAAAEPRLALGARDAYALAPLAERWAEQGVPEPEVRALLADGLPPIAFSARGLLTDRLVRKLPIPRPRPRRDEAAPAPGRGRARARPGRVRTLPRPAATRDAHRDLRGLRGYGRHP